MFKVKVKFSRLPQFWLSNFPRIQLDYHRRGSLRISRRKNSVEISRVTREARKLDHHVQSIYYDSDYPILVVQLLKNEQELHLAETIIYDGYQVELSRVRGRGSIVGKLHKYHMLV